MNELTKKIKYTYARYRGFTVDFSDLVCPDAWAIHPGVLFETLRWVSKTFDRPLGEFGKDWKDEMRTIWTRLLFRKHLQSDEVKWRSDHFITAYSSVFIDFPATAGMRSGNLDDLYETGSLVDFLLQRYTPLSSSIGKLNVSLNKIHKRAKTLKRVKLSPGYKGAGWTLWAYYGFATDGCEWSHEVATQQEHEAFPHFIRRAYEILKSMLEEPKGKGARKC